MLNNKHHLPHFVRHFHLTLYIQDSFIKIDAAAFKVPYPLLIAAKRTAALQVPLYA